MKYQIDAQVFAGMIANLDPVLRGPYIMNAAIDMIGGVCKEPWLSPLPKARATKASKHTGDYSDAFKEFWEAYPKKTGKGAAYLVWLDLSKQIKEDTLLSMCLKALKWQSTSHDWAKDSGKYIVMPSRYLNERRFEDEPVGVQQTKSVMTADGSRINVPI